MADTSKIDLQPQIPQIPQILCCILLWNRDRTHNILYFFISTFFGNSVFLFWFFSVLLGALFLERSTIFILMFVIKIGKNIVITFLFHVLIHHIESTYFVSTHPVLSLFLSHHFSPCIVALASVFNDGQQPGCFIGLKDSWWFIQEFFWRAHA